MGYFYEKSGKIWNSQGIFYNLYPIQGKLGKTDYSVRISFSLTLCMVVCKVIVPFAISECELLSLCTVLSQVCVHYLSSRLHFLFLFCEYVKWGQRKSVFDYQSGVSQGIVEKF